MGGRILEDEGKLLGGGVSFVDCAMCFMGFLQGCHSIKGPMGSSLQGLPRATQLPSPVGNSGLLVGTATQYRTIQIDDFKTERVAYGCTFGPKADLGHFGRI